MKKQLINLETELKVYFVIPPEVPEISTTQYIIQEYYNDPQNRISNIIKKWFGDVLNFKFCEIRIRIYCDKQFSKSEKIYLTLKGHYRKSISRKTYEKEITGKQYLELFTLLQKDSMLRKIRVRWPIFYKYKRKHYVFFIEHDTVINSPFHFWEIEFFPENLELVKKLLWNLYGSYKIFPSKVVTNKKLATALKIYDPIS